LHIIKLINPCFSYRSVNYNNLNNTENNNLDNNIIFNKLIIFPNNAQSSSNIVPSKLAEDIAKLYNVLITQDNILQAPSLSSLATDSNLKKQLWKSLL